MSLGVTILLTPFIIIYNQKKVSEYNTFLISRLTQRIYQSERELNLLKSKSVDEVEEEVDYELQEKKKVEIEELPSQIAPKTVIKEEPIVGASLKAPKVTKRFDLSEKTVRQYKDNQITNISSKTKIPITEPKIEQVQKKINERELGGYNFESWLLFGTVGFIVLAVSLILGSIILENIPKIETNILFNAGDLLFFLTIISYLVNITIFYAPIISKYRNYRKISFVFTGILGLISLFVIRFSTGEISILNFLELPHNITPWLGTIFLLILFVLTNFDLNKLENIVISSLYIFFIFDYTFVVNMEDFYFFATISSISFLISLSGITLLFLSKNITRLKIGLASIPILGITLSLVHDFAFFRLLEWYAPSIMILASGPIIFGTLLSIYKRKTLEPTNFLLFISSLISVYVLAFLYTLTENYPVFDFLMITIVAILPSFLLLFIFNQNMKREISIMFLLLSFISIALLNVLLPSFSESLNVIMPVFSVSKLTLLVLLYYTIFSLVLLKSRAEPVNFRFSYSLNIIVLSILFAEIDFFLVLFTVMSIILVIEQNKENHSLTSFISDRSILISIPYLIIIFTSILTRYSYYELLFLPGLLILYTVVYRNRLFTPENFIGFLILSIFYSVLAVISGWNQTLFPEIIITESIIVNIIFFTITILFIKKNTIIVPYSLIHSLIPLATIALSVVYLNIESDLLLILFITTLIGPFTTLIYTLKYLDIKKVQNYYEMYLVGFSFLVVVVMWFEEYILFNFYIFIIAYLLILLLGQFRLSQLTTPDFVIATFSPVILFIIKELKIYSLKTNPETPEIVIFNISIFLVYLIGLILVSLITKERKELFKVPSLMNYSFQIFLGVLIIFQRISDITIVSVLFLVVISLVTASIIFKNYFNYFENSISLAILLIIIFLTLETTQLSEILLSILTLLYLFYWFTTRFNARGNFSLYMLVWEIIIIFSAFIFIDKFELRLQPWVSGVYYLVISSLLVTILLINARTIIKNKNIVVFVNLLEVFLVLSVLILHQVNAIYSIKIFFPITIQVDLEIAFIWLIALIYWFIILSYSLGISIKGKISNPTINNVFSNIPLIFLSGFVLTLTNFALWFLDMTTAGFLVNTGLLISISIIILFSKITSNIEQSSNTLIGMYLWLLILLVAFFSDINLLSGIIAIIGAIIWIVRSELHYHEYHNYISLFFIGIGVIHFFVNFIISFSSLTIELGLIALLIGFSLGSILYYNRFKKINGKELS